MIILLEVDIAGDIYIVAIHKYRMRITTDASKPFPGGDVVRGPQRDQIDPYPVFPVAGNIDRRNTMEIACHINIDIAVRRGLRHRLWFRRRLIISRLTAGRHGQQRDDQEDDAPS